MEGLVVRCLPYWSKIENLIPDGFKLMKAPKAYGLEDHRLNMKEKRLGPLKTEEVKLV